MMQLAIQITEICLSELFQNSGPEHKGTNHVTEAKKKRRKAKEKGGEKEWESYTQKDCR
jgi:hypothetical protein